MLNFVLWLVFFFCLHTDKNIAVLSQLGFFALNTDKHLAILSKRTFDILDTIESESTTRFKNRSSDRMMTSDWLVDVSDDRYTTNRVYPRFTCPL
jgi:hypothetical protein